MKNDDLSLPMLSEQCRAARALLDWSQEQLAEKARVGVSTVRDFEAERRKPRADSLERITSAFVSAGIVVIDKGAVSKGGVGVRFSK